MSYRMKKYLMCFFSFPIYIYEKIAFYLNVLHHIFVLQLFYCKHISYNLDSLIPEYNQFIKLKSQKQIEFNQSY